MTGLNMNTEFQPHGTLYHQLPVLSLEQEAIRANNIVGFNSRDIQSRPFNLLRSSFAKKLKEGGHRLIGITSATPAAGKSFLTVNLGASLAIVSDDPVYLVDLDLRRASLASEIGFEPNASVADYLSGHVDNLKKIGVRVNDANLALFPAIRSRNPPVELLSNERFPQMIASMREQTGRSTILFDLPPAFADDDAMICLEHLDAFILVVDTGKTTANQIRGVLDMMRPKPCIGTILNRYNGGLADKYGYGYGYGYKGYEAYY